MSSHMVVFERQSGGMKTLELRSCCSRRVVYFSLDTAMLSSLCAIWISLLLKLHSSSATSNDPFVPQMSADRLRKNQVR